MTAELVDELARLDRQRCRDLVDAAQQERQLRIRHALRKIRRVVLPGLKDRPAARAIDDAVQGQWASAKRVLSANALQIGRASCRERV